MQCLVWGDRSKCSAMRTHVPFDGDLHLKVEQTVRAEGGTVFSTHRVIISLSRPLPIPPGGCDFQNKRPRPAQPLPSLLARHRAVHRGKGRLARCFRR